MAIIKCPECGHDVSDRAKTCPHCGVAIAGQLINCPDCGEVILKDIPQCPYCHCTINGAEQAYMPVVKLPAQQSSADEEAKTAAPSDGQQAPVKKVKRSYAAVIVSLVLALIVILLGLYFYQSTQRQNEQRAYQNAITSSEPAVLRNFLDVYPEASSAHRDSINHRLQLLMQVEQEWQKAIDSGNRQLLAAYVSRHPGNIHVTEANILIDSIDWQTALQENTVESYQIYLDEHPDGINVPEARDRHDQLDALRLKPEEQERLTQLMKSFYTALSTRDEAALTALLASQLSLFMQKQQAEPADVVNYMRSIYELDVLSITMSPVGEWNIQKQPTQREGRFTYTLQGTVEKRIERINPLAEHFASYAVTAEVNANGRLSALSMQRMQK